MAKKKQSEMSKFLFVGVVLLGVMLIARDSVSSDGRVLGIFLADKGSDDGGSSGSGSSGSGSSGSGSSSDDDRNDDNSGSGSSGSGSSGSGSSGSGSDNGGSSGSGSSGSGSSGSGSSGGSDDGGVDDDDRGVCTGPDGTTFTSSFEDCRELNDAWGNGTNFSVTQRASQTRVRTQEVEDEDENENEVEDELENENEVENEVENENEVEDENETEEERFGRFVRRLRDSESEQELRLSESERIRVRTKDGRQRVDVYSGGVKTRFEVRDDRVIVKAELEGGEEEELEENDLFSVVDRIDRSALRVATASGERFVVARGETGAATEFPLTIDFATNALSVLTPQGTKEVTILPDQATSAVLALGLIDQIRSLDQNEVEGVTTVGQLVELVTEDGEAVYEINGVYGQRLLGLIPINLPRTVVVSAEDGDLIETRQGALFSLLDLISI